MASARALAVNQSSFTWDDYISVVLTESGHVSAATIQSLASGNVWAGSSSLRLTPKEVHCINEGFTDDQHLRTCGITLGGRPFTLSRIAEGRIMVGRDAKSSAGCVLYRCNQCLITGIYEESNHPGQCYNIILQLGDYLVESGF